VVSEKRLKEEQPDTFGVPLLERGRVIKKRERTRKAPNRVGYDMDFENSN